MNTIIIEDIFYICERRRAEKRRYVRICIFLYALMTEVLECGATFLDSERKVTIFKLSPKWGWGKKKPLTLPSEKKCLEKVCAKLKQAQRPWKSIWNVLILHWF